MKILHVINSLETGGAEKLLAEALPIYEKKGVTADILLLKRVNTSLLQELESINKNKIFSLDKSSVYNPLKIFKIKSYIKDYDIIHVHLFPTFYYVALSNILFFFGKKMVYTEHSNHNRRLNSKYFKVIDKIFYSIYTKIICISDGVKEALMEKLNIGKEKLIVINNGLNISKIEESVPHSKEKLGFSQNDSLLVMVAGFRKEKDHKTVICALKHLPENYKLILVGEGETQAEAKELAKAQNLEKRVFFLGIRDDVYSIFKACDIAILSSHWEGFGLVVLESILCGKPTLVSDVPGLCQRVENGAIPFQKSNSVELSQKILELMKNENLYKSTVVEAFSKSRNYSIEEMVDKYIKLYKSILK